MAYLVFRGMSILTLRTYFGFMGSFSGDFFLVFMRVEKFIVPLTTNIENIFNTHKVYFLMIAQHIDLSW
jgi:hypothetical protein